MNGLDIDRQLILDLCEFAQMTPTALAAHVGVAVTTIQRHHKGTALTRLSQPTLDKLRARFPEFPGWLQPSLQDTRLSFRGAPVEQVPNLVKVAAIDLNFGLGSAFMDQEVVEHQAETMHFPATWLRQITTSPPDQLYWTRGVGNSMEPAIGDGDVILIDRSKIGSSFGDLYWAIAYGQTGMIKRLRPMPDGSVKILSDNPSVLPEIAYDGELHIFGRVVAVVRRL